MEGRRADRLDDFMERPKRAVWVIAGPLMVGFTVHALYMVVDAIFIGRLGPEALAASTFISAFFFTAIALSNGLATGVTATIAQAVGRRDRDAGDLVASNGVGIGMGMGVVFAAVGFAAGEDIIPLLGAEGESARLAWDYLFPLCFGMPLMFTATGMRSVLSGEGDARTPMVILTIGTLTNLALDPFFMFFLDLGIAGAGYATLTAQLVGFLALTYMVLVRKATTARFRLSMMPPRKKVVAGIVSLGIPASTVHFVMAAGLILTNRVIAAFGQKAVAGYGAGSKIDMIAALPIMGLASAAVTLVGMFAGANRADLVRTTALYTYRWALTAAGAFGVLFYFGAGHFIGVFTEDPYTLEIGVEYIGWAVFGYPFMAIGMTTGRILQGLGFGWPTLVITGLRVLAVGVAASYTAVYLFDAPIESIWISFICGGAAASALSIAWVRKYVWKNDPCVVATKGSHVG